MSPVPNDTSKSRRQNRIGHSVKFIDSHDKMQDFVGSAERADKDDISAASDSISQVLNAASDISAASDSISQVLNVASHGHVGTGGVAYQGDDKNVSHTSVDCGMKGTYGRGHKHGQEHGQFTDSGESSTCASVALTFDPSRVSCSSSTIGTVFTTTIGNNRSEHEALDPITQVVLIPDVPVSMKPHDHVTTTTTTTNTDTGFIQPVIAPLASFWRKPRSKEPACTQWGKTPPSGFSWSSQIQVRVC